VASKRGHPASHGEKLLCYKAAKAPSNTSATTSTSSSFPIYPQNFPDSFGISLSVIMILPKWLEVPGDENVIPNRWNNDDIKPTEKARREWTFWTFNNFCSSVNILMAKLFIILIVDFSSSRALGQRKYIGISIG